MTLTGDATIGGAGRFDLRGPSSGDPGMLDLAGFTLTKVGTGAFGLVRDNVTAGNIHLVGGNINLEQSTTLAAGTLTFEPGTTLQFNSFGGSIAGSFVSNGGTITDVTQAFATTLNVPITVNGDTTVNVNSSGGLTLAGVVSGTAGIIKTGSDTPTLAATNTYSGVTTINNGVLSVGSSSNLGNGSATNNLAFGGGGAGERC